MIPFGTLKARHRAPADLLIGDERGVALILALLVTLALSALTASLMLTSRTETFSGMNYRLLAQTRYGAEAGMHQTVNYLLNSYTPPGGAGDPLANYDTTVSPVTYNGNPVVLSSMGGVAANYPVASVVNGFQTGTPGTLANGAFTVNYTSYATLLTMRQINPVYGSTTPVTIMTWRVTADGSVGSLNAKQEVSAVLEQQFARPFNYGVFADGAGCNTLGFSGGGIVDSYDSTAITWSGVNVVTQASGGNVGTNGSVGASANTTIDGSLSVPRVGVGACGASPGTPYPTVTGGIVELPQTIPYPPPGAPSPMPPTGSVTLAANDCAGLSPPFCTPVADGVQLSAGTYPDLIVANASVLHLVHGNIYTINSLSLTGGSQLWIDPTAPAPPSIVNVAGQNKSAPIDLTGGTLINSSLNPSNLQIQYSGSGQLTLTGSNRAAGLIYAPNASVVLAGGSDWFGSIVARTFDDPGAVALHFDRHLQGSSFFTPGNWALNSFTWKTY
jgi:hypothetical protein